VSHPRGDAYQSRFDELAASGVDVHGEANFVLAHGPGRVLDAGCGTGRVAIELARHGLDVVGVDVDAAMLKVARGRAPELDWRVGDLATCDLEPGAFDLAVLAGNVLLFVTPGTEAQVVANVARALVAGGRLVAGFSVHPGGYDLERLEADAARAGLVLEERWATGDREPYAGGDYAVSVLVRIS
jgi:SAM-dependent methyltransferase